MPVIQSPAGPMAVRSPSFAIAGFTVFSLRELSRTQFTLNKVILEIKAFIAFNNLLMANITYFYQAVTLLNYLKQFFNLLNLFIQGALQQSTGRAHLPGDD